MKSKLGLVLFIWCFSTFGAKAQYFKDEDDRTFYGGLVLGANFCQVDGDNMVGYHKVGINAGAISYFMLDEKIAGSVEINYTQKGSKSTPDQLQAVSNIAGRKIYAYSIDLNYAEVPLMINYFDKNHSHIGAGVSVGATFNPHEKVTDINGTVDDQILYPYKKYDLSFVLGGSLKVQKHIFLDMRFNYSMLNIRKDYNIDLGQRRIQANRVLALRLQYIF